MMVGGLSIPMFGREPFQALVNGGFDTGTTGAEWTLTNMSVVTSVLSLFPQSGSYFLRGMQAGTCSAVQTASCVGYGSYAFSGWISNYFAGNVDGARILLEAFNGSWSTLYDTGSTTGNNLPWINYTASGSLPSGSTQVRLSLLGTRAQPSDLDAYFDSMSLILS